MGLTRQPNNHRIHKIVRNVVGKDDFLEKATNRRRKQARLERRLGRGCILQDAQN